jgi:predicted DNA-binding transcriptional regulator AlpA
MNVPAEKPDADEWVLLDAVETCRFFGGSNSPLNPATLYRGIKAGKYPKPIKIGPGTSRWVLGECQQKLRDLIAERDATAAA